MISMSSCSDKSHGGFSEHSYFEQLIRYLKEREIGYGILTGCFSFLINISQGAITIWATWMLVEFLRHISRRFLPYLRESKS